MFNPEQMRRMDQEDRKRERDNIHDRVGTSQGRYRQRIEAFRKAGRVFEFPTHWLFHNCVAHPLLGLLPNKKTVQLHNVTSDVLNLRDRKEHWRVSEIRNAVPEIPNRADWIFHNCLVHMAIGLFPSALTFDLHDWSADRMDIPGWV